ncbi:RICIN domain-containing protein [Natrialbaceae archaeon A-arb3/5]
MTEETTHQAKADESKRTIVGSVNRRDWLRTIGGTGVIGLVGLSGAGTTSADSHDWEADADQRIAQHRQGTLEIEVVDESGQPIPDADVDVEMQEHEFGFGAAISAPTLLGEDDDVTGGDLEEYRSIIPDLFNKAVLGNAHKWRMWEEDQEQADEATAWLLDHGLEMRGHTCVWGSLDSWSIPGDVVDAMGSDHESGDQGPDHDPDHVIQRSLEHIEEIITHYADFEYDGTDYGSVIDQWDVVNEVVNATEMIEAVEGEDADPAEAPVLEEWYEQATDVAPADVALDVNDFNVIVGPWEDTRDDYHRQIEFLDDADGVRVDGVGLQSHFDENSALTPEEILDALDDYAAHGAEIRVTEFDASDDDWADEEQGEFLYQYLKLTFSHEAVSDFMIWGPWDGEHWLDDAPLFYEDWTPKPGYDAYVDLVFNEWWTSESTAAGSDGTAAVEAFLGEHEVTVSTADGTQTEFVTVTDPYGSQSVTVTVGDGDGEIADGTYVLENVNSEKALDVAGGSTDDGANVQQYESWGGEGQQWEVEHQGNGEYTLLNVNSGKALDVEDSSTDDGANVQQWEPWDGEVQRWELIDADGEGYVLENVNSGKALDVEDGATDDGANVQQWDSWGGEMQRWTFEPV